MIASLWRLYACVLCTYFAWLLWHSDFDVMSIISLFFMFVNLIGLCGFTFEIALLAPLVWKLYFALLVSIISGFIVTGWQIEVSIADAIFALMSNDIILIQLPLIYALWAYGYRSRALWK